MFVPFFCKHFPNDMTWNSGSLLSRSLAFTGLREYNKGEVECNLYEKIDVWDDAGVSLDRSDMSQ